jgi:hypothetical protein
MYNEGLMKCLKSVRSVFLKIYQKKEIEFLNKSTQHEDRKIVTKNVYASKLIFCSINELFRDYIRLVSQESNYTNGSNVTAVEVCQLLELHSLQYTLTDQV